MRFVLRACLASLLLLAVAPGAARAADDPEREDVVLQGRLLRPDGTPAANTPVSVNVKDGFGFFNFFATLGLSTLSCFGGANGLCPIQPGKHWETVTDANGRYSFTFKDAKRPGEQTNTDYFFNAGIPSKSNPKEIVVASYELELLTSVHNAPDVRLWDPATSLRPAEGGYEVSFPPRPESNNGALVLFGDREAPSNVMRNGFIDARAVEDSVFSVVPRSSKDEFNEGTIYHQRFRAASVTRRGTLVPISRGAACTAVRKDGSRTTCAATDGDLTNRAVHRDDMQNICGRFDYEMKADGYEPNCAEPVTEITIDMGQPKPVGEVRPRCDGCKLSASADGTNWTILPVSGVVNTPAAYRYVRLNSETTLEYVPEVSVWPAAEVEAISPLPEEEVEPISPLRPTPASPNRDGERPTNPWGQIALGVAVFSAVLYLGRKAVNISE